MQTAKTLNRFAIPTKIVMTFLTLAMVIVCLQVLINELYLDFYYHGRSGNITQRSLTEPEKHQKQIHEARKEFTTEGRLYLAQYNIAVPTLMGKKMTVRITDPNEKLIFEGHQDNQPLQFIAWYAENENRYRSRFNERNLAALDVLRENFSRCYTVPVVDENNHRIEHWGLDTHRQIFKGYAVSGEPLGFLGANGYTSDIGQALPLGKCVMLESWVETASFDPRIMFQTDSAVYQISFQSRRVETLIKTENDPVRYVVQNNWKELGTSPNRPMIAIGTLSGKVLFHLKNPAQTIESQLERYPQIAASNDKIWVKTEFIKGCPSSLNNRNYIQQWTQWCRENLYHPRDRVVTLYELTDDGVLQEKNRFEWIEPANTTTFHSNQADIFHSIVNSVTSPVPAWAAALIRRYHNEPQWLRDFFQITRTIYQYHLPVNLFIMTVMAVLTALHGRPRQMNRLKLAGWVLFVFLFNLAGLLTYLALNHTAVIRCEKCGKRRGLSTDACPHCSARLPGPRPKPTDLLMPLKTLGTA